jgi:hypothetical protein
MAEITRYRGDTAPDRFTVKDVDGTVINITSYTFLLTVDEKKNPANTATQVFQIAGVIIDAVNGVVEFEPTTGNANQVPDTYWYDVQMIDPDGRITTLAKDEYIFVQDISK